VAQAIDAISLGRLPEATRGHFVELQQLGRIGHVRGIEHKLAEIESDHPDCALIVAGLRDMVRNFELKRFLDVVKTAHPRD
jgi:hypothetical protein